MNIHVRVERVVLDGIAVPAGDLRDLQASIQAELTWQLIAHGIAPAFLMSPAPSHLTAATLPLSIAATPHQLGSDIGRAAFGTFGNADASFTGGSNHG